MRCILVCLIFLCTTIVVSAQDSGRFISVDGNQVWVHESGLEDRKFGQPVVIFQSSPGDPINRFSKVFEQVSTYAPVIAYDVLPVKNSDASGQSVTDESPVDDLKMVLDQLDLAPPYILVGNGWGAVYSQEFAKAYPEEVLGLLYLDPIAPTEDLSFSVSELTVNGQEGQTVAAQYLSLQTLNLVAGNSQGNREVDVLKSKLEDPNFYVQTTANHEIPTVFMFGKLKHSMTFDDSLFIAGKDLLEQRIQQRIDYFQNLTSKQENSTLLISSQAISFLPVQAPVAVSLQIKQLLYSDPLRRIWSASKTMEPKDFERFLTELRSYIPEFLISERDLNMIGYSMIRSDLYQHALVIFADNLKNHPNSANAYDSYGDGLFALGRVQESLDVFRKAVELGEQENHSDLGLFIKNLKKSEEIVAN